MCCVSFRWLIWFSRQKACGVSTWNLDIRVLLVKLFCQTLWDSQPTKQPKKIKLLLAFTSGLFLIVSVGISGLGLLSCHLSVRITCFSYCSLLPATYFKRWNSLNGFLFSSLTVLPAYLKCSTALYAKLYAVLVLLFNKKKATLWFYGVDYRQIWDFSAFHFETKFLVQHAERNLQEIMT